MTQRIKISDRTIMYREKAPMQPRCITRPECGYWAVRLVSRGIEVAASIQYEQTTVEPGEPTNLMVRSPILTARLNGEIVTVEEVWTRRGREISKSYHDWLIEDRKWARTYKPDDPAANPRQHPDLRKLPPVAPPPRRR